VDGCALPIGGLDLRSMDKPRITLVICTYNRRESLLDTLETVAAQRCDVPWEVLVVDKNSDDGTPAAVSERALIIRAPKAARRSWSSPPVVPGPMATASRISTGPVSSPSSIRMTMIPVGSSPAMIARWIGAAPRQRGRSEA